jgi:hypothetical protein
MKVLISLSFLSLLGACSVSVDDPETKGLGVKKVTESENEYVSPVAVKGYVSSAFDLTVDGKNYADSEDFYSEQLETLEQQKNDGGYDDYVLSFEAEVGLGELKNGMDVFVVATAEQGFAGETGILYDGTFQVNMPGDAIGDSFQVRANKRIGVILTNSEGNQIRWCYNFYGSQKFTLEENPKPIILRHFFTKLTKYRCSDSKASALEIPAKETPAPAPSSTPSQSSEPAVTTEEEPVMPVPAPTPTPTTDVLSK